MVINKRFCPLFAIRNVGNDNPISANDEWIALTHFSSKFIPTPVETKPKVGEMVSVFQYNDAILPSIGRIISWKEDKVTIQRDNGRKIKKDICKVFDENINASHLFLKWEYSETNRVSLLIYQNCKNRIFLHKGGKEHRVFLGNNKFNLITDKLLVNQENLINTEGQLKNFETFEVKKPSLELSRSCRENIFSFHFKIFYNILPIYNREKECKLCRKKL